LYFFKLYVFAVVGHRKLVKLMLKMAENDSFVKIFILVKKKNGSHRKFSTFKDNK